MNWTTAAVTTIALVLSYPAKSAEISPTDCEALRTGVINMAETIIEWIRFDKTMSETRVDAILHPKSAAEFEESKRLMAAYDEAVKAPRQKRDQSAMFRTMEVVKNVCAN